MVSPVSQTVISTPSFSEISVTTQIYEYALSCLARVYLFYQEGDFSHKIYHIAQVALWSTACAGYVVACSIFIGGFIKLAGCMSCLASASMVGSYIAYQARMEQSLAESAEQFKQHNSALKSQICQLQLTNDTLSKTSAALEQTQLYLQQQNEQLSVQVNQLGTQNTRLEHHVNGLENVHQTLSQEMSLLSSQLAELEEVNADLLSNVSWLQKEMNAFSVQNAQFRQLAKECKEQSLQLLSEHRDQNTVHKQLLSENQAQNTVQKMLIERFSEQIAVSDKLWSQIFKQGEQNQRSQAELLAELNRNVSLLEQLRLPELHQTMREETRGLIAQFYTLQQGLTTLMQEISEKTTWLETLKQEHHQILEEHHEIIRLQKRELSLFMQRAIPKAVLKNPVFLRAALHSRASRLRKEYDLAQKEE